MDGSRFDHLARLVSRRSRRQVLGGLAGMATAALFSRTARAQSGCDPDPCDPNAFCSENPTHPSVPDCTCNDGYAGNGFTCTDIDECADGNACGLNAICANTPGSFNCSCAPGYQGNPPTTPCTDTNECAANPCDPNATCTNTLGSFTCTCPTGYEGDGLATGTGCTDVDECTNGSNPCDPNATCTNTPGSFS